MSDLTKQIEKIISNAMPDAQVTVSDPMNDGAHLEAIVICESFAGMSLVNQHRQVMRSLKDSFSGDLHALALKTYTPEKWANAKN
jgi:acid stress-induced BolA-like protein IbaG/YrbA